jgi:1,4-alpha-glucan branching enzyme
MSVRYAVSLVLNAHLPYIREFSAPHKNPALMSDEQPLPDGQSTAEQPVPDEPPEEIDLTPATVEESWFFEALSETYLPLLMLFDRLEADHVPFRLGISLSPVFAQMLGDEFLQKKYAAYLDHQIDFGRQEIERLGRANVPQNDDPPSDAPSLDAPPLEGMRLLAQRYFDQAIDRRAAFTTRYEGNIFKAFDYYQRKRKIEFLAAPATHPFLPFLCPFPEAVQAQIETALSFYRYALGINPQGFWLPELGWSKDIDPFLRSYGFNYTIADAHGFVLGNPPPSRGCFFPVRTPHGIFVLSRDFDACSGIAAMRQEGPYRDNSRDIGYELPPEMIGPFLAQNGARCQTGYKYRQSGDMPYNPQAAQAAAQDHARTFLENCCHRLDSVLQHTQELPLSLCAFNADSFGRHWHEGTLFLESLFRFAADYRDLQFMTPSEYLYHQQISALEVSLPELSSWGDNGYAETWLDSSNDWIYRHLNRSIDRMVELADRFSRNSSLKERALNQAAREILLAMASDWPAFLYRQECTGYARRQVEDSLQNFTTIYEALGSNYISTEWLTNLESRHDIFPNINYRVFKRKH